MRPDRKRTTAQRWIEWTFPETTIDRHLRHPGNDLGIHLIILKDNGETSIRKSKSK